MDLGDRLDELLATYAVPGVQVGSAPRRRASRASPAGPPTSTGTRPAEATTAFHAGSIAKSLAGLVVLDAARRGEVDLDAPCSAQAEGLWDDTPRVVADPDHRSTQRAARARRGPRVLRGPGRGAAARARPRPLLLLQRRVVGARPAAASAHRCRVRGAGRRGSRRAPAGRVGPEVAPRFGVPEGASRPHALSRDGVAVEVPGDLADAASAAGSRWWATADELLDWASLQLAPPPAGTSEIVTLRAPGARLPGGTVFDTWGHGWALWDRGAHQAFGWAGYTGGHRAYLRCFPDQDAALVVLANAAGPAASARPGGSALFDVLLPDLLEVLDVPPLPPPSEAVETPHAALPTDLAGRYGPLGVEALPSEPGRPDACSPTPPSSASRERCASCAGPAAASSSPGEPPGELAAGLRGRPRLPGPVRPARSDPTAGALDTSYGRPGRRGRC